MNDPHLFNGPEYVPSRDNGRLLNQIQRVYMAMEDGHWRTLEEIGAMIGDPVASISAQLRHLRKKKHGGFTVLRRSRRGSLFEYRLIVRNVPAQPPKEEDASGSPAEAVGF